MVFRRFDRFTRRRWKGPDKMFVIGLALNVGKSGRFRPEDAVVDRQPCSHGCRSTTASSGLNRPLLPTFSARPITNILSGPFQRRRVKRSNRRNTMPGKMETAIQDLHIHTVDPLPSFAVPPVQKAPPGSLHEKRPGGIGASRV